ncbi:hypothetical protein CIC12_10650 [Burkholderia sp. SG-MS1]|nr:hypothetical protein [Paraburkholderia sp. SG-MS1]
MALSEQIGRSSPFIAPGARYIWFNNDHHRRSETIHADIAAAHQLIRNTVVDMRDGEADGTAWHLLASRAIEAENFVREILASDDGGFEDRRDEQGLLTELTRLPLGEYFGKTLMAGKYLTDIETVEPYRFRPLAQVFFDVRHSEQFDQYSFQDFKSPPWLRSNEAEPFAFEKFNKLLGAVRTVARARKLDQLEKWNTSQAKQRFKAMMRHVHKYFRKRRRIFVIRMDLYYREELAVGVSIDLAKAHHALLVNRLRALTHVRTDLVGGIWKLEWTQRKGHHFHWVFMFDGSRVQDAQTWFERIDAQWCNVVPEDAGYTHCGNYDKHRQIGTGMIHLDNDPETLEIFEEKVIGYLAKKDQALCVKAAGGSDTWGTFTPAGKRTSNAGRPPKPRMCTPA